MLWGDVALSQWDKLIDEILQQNPSLRFDDLYKALVKMGYTPERPRGGQQPLHILQGWLYAHYPAEAHPHEKGVYQSGG